MKIITLKTARSIAADWHGGQWSALYAFASSGTMDAAQEPRCLMEVEENLSNKNTSPEQCKRLEQLKRFITLRFQNT